MATETNNIKDMKAITDYVNKVCSAFLKPHSEFLSIECKYVGTEGEGYIRMQTSSDEVHFYDLIGLTAEEVCEMVVKMVSGAHIKREIEDKDRRREVALLFR